MIVALFGVAAAGCGGRDGPQAASTPIDQQRVGELLAAADRADGTEDHVVARCAVCGLGMDGSAEITSTYAGYTFHHCSVHCRELFDRDPGKILARLELPPPEGAAAEP